MKKYLIGFILGAIIFGSICANAAIKIEADKVFYSENVTVKDKIDNLYTTATSTINSKDQQIQNLTTSNNTLTNQVSELTTQNQTLQSQLNTSNCTSWTQIENATVALSSTLAPKPSRINLYKCGNMCLIDIALDYATVNTAYQLITNPDYYPKETTGFSGVGANNGYCYGELYTNGKINITKQGITNTGWVSGKITYFCY